MRNLLTIFFVLGLLICKGQSIKIDTCFENTSSKQFFYKNPLVEKIGFSLHASGTKYITIYKKGIWQDSSFKFSNPGDYETFKLDFIGDNFFFDEYFGGLPFPERELASISKDKCNSFYSASGYIYPDSVRCKVEFDCPVESKLDTNERIFTKVEVLFGYKNGMKALQQKIQAAYQSKYFNKGNQTDSAYLFSIILDRKDGCLLRIELTYGTYSPLAQFLIDEFRTACEWKPAEQGGRPVRSYSKIFVRFNEDGSILVATPTDQPEQK